MMSERAHARSDSAGLRGRRVLHRRSSWVAAARAPSQMHCPQAGSLTPYTHSARACLASHGRPGQLSMLRWPMVRRARRFSKERIRATSHVRNAANIQTRPQNKGSAQRRYRATSHKPSDIALWRHCGARGERDAHTTTAYVRTHDSSLEECARARERGDRGGGGRCISRVQLHTPL